MAPPISTPRTGLTLSIIGCGVMGSAILSGVLDSCARTEAEGGTPRFTRFFACVNSEGSLERLKVRFEKYLDRLTVLAKDNIQGMQAADVVMLGCKPYMVEDLLGHGRSDGDIQNALVGKLFISFVVGTPLNKIRKAIYGDQLESSKSFYPVRAMMNIAAELGESLTVIEDDVDLPSDLPDITDWIFAQLGTTTHVPPNLFDVGGVGAGVSLGLISVAVDGILDGMVHEGIKRVEGRKMMAQSLKGLAALLEAGETPDVLRERFSSPRGTTIEGLLSLEEDRVRYAYSKAVMKATQRSQTM